MAGFLPRLNVTTESSLHRPQKGPGRTWIGMMHLVSIILDQRSEFPFYLHLFLVVDRSNCLQVLTTNIIRIHHIMLATKGPTRSTNRIRACVIFQVDKHLPAHWSQHLACGQWIIHTSFEPKTGTWHYIVAYPTMSAVIDPVLDDEPAILTILRCLAGSVLWSIRENCYTSTWIL
jgi:hypothetical protein